MWVHSAFSTGFSSKYAPRKKPGTTLCIALTQREVYKNDGHKKRPAEFLRFVKDADI
jgi:hypothetical protein